MSEDKQDDLYEEKVDTSWYDGPSIEEQRYQELTEAIAELRREILAIRSAVSAS